jgi:hypothetical protein
LSRWLLAEGKIHFPKVFPIADTTTTSNIAPRSRGGTTAPNKF